MNVGPPSTRAKFFKSHCPCRILNNSIDLYEVILDHILSYVVCSGTHEEGYLIVSENEWISNERTGNFSFLDNNPLSIGFSPWLTYSTSDDTLQSWIFSGVYNAGEANATLVGGRKK
jgi:hypothetical protein